MASDFFRGIMGFFAVGMIAGAGTLMLLPQDSPQASVRLPDRIKVPFARPGLRGGRHGVDRGVVPVAAVLLAVIVPASIVGVWLFSLQHHFDGTHWARHVQWDPVDAALRGSSFLRLPRLLQWMTGNIGFHHVHHASPRVPNYRLEACHSAHPGFAVASVLTLAGVQAAALSAFGAVPQDHETGWDTCHRLSQSPNPAQ
jgi:hypothetical protein